MYFILNIIIIIFVKKKYVLAGQGSLHLKRKTLYYLFLNHGVSILHVDLRQQCRFHGFSIYVSNTGAKESSYLCHKDGPQLPPLNFTATCNDIGRYVIFYNERLKGVTYPTECEQLSEVFTELCEVIVSGKFDSLKLSKGLYKHSIYNFSLDTFTLTQFSHILTPSYQKAKTLQL